MRLFDRAMEFLDDLAWRISPHPPIPTGEPVCNVSDETNEWNRRALEYAWTPGNGIVPLPRKTFSAEEMRRMQENTYESNARALDYAKRKG